MNRNHINATFFLSLILMMFVGCAQLGIAPAQTFKEKLAVGYTTVTGIRTMAASLLVSGNISADDAQNVQNQADNARAGLDIARKLSGTDMTAANAKLTMTTAVLTAVNNYLIAKKGATP